MRGKWYSAIGLVLLLAACAGGSSNAGGTSVITIPVIYSATGVSGSFGGSARVGFELALSEINKTGVNGSKLALDYQDDGSQPNSAVSITDQAVKSNAPVIIGPIQTNTASAALPRCKQGKVACLAVVLSSASVAQDAAPYGYSFVMSGDVAATIATAQFLKLLPSVKKFSAIVDKENASMVLQSQGFGAAAKAGGATVNAAQFISESAVDFSPQVTNIKAENPDAIYLAALNGQSPGIVHAIRRQGIKVPIFASTAATTGNFIQTTGADAEGVYTYGDFWIGDPAVAAWVQSVKSYGIAPDTIVAASYDSLKLVAQILTQLGVSGSSGNVASTRSKFADKLAQANYKGVEVGYQFHNGMPTKDIYLLEVKSGILDKATAP